MPDPLHSDLESIFEDEAWKEEQKAQAFAGLKRGLWRVAGIEALIIITFMIVLWVRDNMQNFGLWIVIMILLLLAVQFIASILGAACALFPIKGYDYGHRLEAWIPFWSVVVEALTLAGLVYVAFIFN